MEHFKLPRSIVDREQFVLDLCKGKRILHLGCADFPYTEEKLASGRWLHQKVSNIASSCLGIDLDSDTIAYLRKHYGIKNVIHGNAEHLDDIKEGLFDVILAGEIIEHLNNPGLFLDTARTILKPDGKLIITTVNAFCLRRFIRIPFGSESIHPDHVYYFSHTTLQTLARRFGYKLLEAHSYRLPNVRPFLPYIVERFASAITPNWGEGIIHVYSLTSGSEYE